MYSVFIAGLLLFPWSLAVYIAFGAFCAARRRGIANKQVKQIK